MDLTATDLTLRDLTDDDVPAWARLLADAEAVDDTGEHQDETDLRRDLGLSSRQPGDYQGVWCDGTLVGTFWVLGREPADYLKIHCSGTTHPAHRGRGIGVVLRDAMLARAAAIHAERHPGGRAMVATTGIDGQADQRDLLTGAGFSVDRWSLAMLADLHGDPLTAPDLPAGLVLREFDEALSPLMLAAHNEAFLDHPNWNPWSAAEWQEWVVEGRSFRPRLTVAAVDPAEPDRVVGYVQSAEFEAHQQVTGRREAYVGKVGVLRSHRGLGLATALLREVLVRAQAEGYDEAALDVDSANPTGALGVYERAGFAVRRRWADYVLWREPVSTPGR